MRILCLSDLHGYLPDVSKLPIADLLVIAGDSCPSYNHRLDFQKSWIETCFHPWFKSVNACNKVLIAGNHDFIFESSPKEWAKSLFKTKYSSYLQDNGWESFLHPKVRCWGTPFSPTFGPFAFMGPEAELVKHWEKIPRNIDVLVVHSPPHGYGDKTVDGDITGSPGLTQRILEVKPKLVVCGHIHESRGIYQIGETIVANAAFLDEHYKPYNDAGMVVEITL